MLADQKNPHRAVKREFQQPFVDLALQIIS